VASHMHRLLLSLTSLALISAAPPQKVASVIIRESVDADEPSPAAPSLLAALAEAHAEATSFDDDTISENAMASVDQEKLTPSGEEGEEGGVSAEASGDKEEGGMNEEAVAEERTWYDRHCRSSSSSLQRHFLYAARRDEVGMRKCWAEHDRKMIDTAYSNAAASHRAACPDKLPYCAWLNTHGWCKSPSYQRVTWMRNVCKNTCGYCGKPIVPCRHMKMCGGHYTPHCFESPDTRCPSSGYFTTPRKVNGQLISPQAPEQYRTRAQVKKDLGCYDEHPDWIEHGGKKGGESGVSAACLRFKKSGWCTRAAAKKKCPLTCGVCTG